MARAGGSDDPRRFDALLRAEGLTPHWWSNDPGDRYAAHAHAYEKVLYCVAGSITFVLGPGEERVSLAPGGCLVLAPGRAHAALVGPRGVTCVEGRRKPGEPAAGRA